MPSLIHKPRRKAVLIASGAIVLVILGGVAGFVVLLSGAYSTAATMQHFKLTHRLLDAGLRFSVRSHTGHIEVPELEGSEMLERGASCYRAYCVQCHGAPGVARDPLGRGQLPIASNLAQTAREWPSAWLYYVTKKGVRMSGMPAWEFRMSEEGLWSTVAFLKKMPLMTQVDYLEVSARSASHVCPRATQAPPQYSAERAKVTFRQYACHSCHRIEGVVGPKTYVGPELRNWSRRKYVAGVLPNTKDNLVRFIRGPETVSPGSLMPDLEVTEAHAHEMATYLLALE